MYPPRHSALTTTSSARDSATSAGAPFGSSPTSAGRATITVATSRSSPTLTHAAPIERSRKDAGRARVRDHPLRLLVVGQGWPVIAM